MAFLNSRLCPRGLTLRASSRHTVFNDEKKLQSCKGLGYPCAAAIAAAAFRLVCENLRRITD